MVEAVQHKGAEVVIFSSMHESGQRTYACYYFRRCSEDVSKSLTNWLVLLPYWHSLLISKSLNEKKEKKKKSDKSN